MSLHKYRTTKYRRSKRPPRCNNAIPSDTDSTSHSISQGRSSIVYMTKPPVIKYNRYMSVPAEMGSNPGRLWVTLTQSVSSNEANPSKQFVHQDAVLKALCAGGANPKRASRRRHRSNSDARDAPHHVSFTNGQDKERVELQQVMANMVSQGTSEGRRKVMRDRRLAFPDISGSLQNEIKRRLWLELQAWYTELTVEETQRALDQGRGNAEQLLIALANFQFPENTAEGAILTQRHVSEQQRAISTIQDYFYSSLDSVASLWPSTAALCAEVPFFNDSAFLLTRETLNVWYNLVTTMHSRLKLFGRLFGVPMMPLSVAWPCINPASELDEAFALSLQVKANEPLHRILRDMSKPANPQDDPDNEDDPEVDKLEKSMDKQHLNDEDTTVGASIYRPYVDQLLKKTELTKLAHVFKKILRLSMVTFNANMQPRVNGSTVRLVSCEGINSTSTIVPTPSTSTIMNQYYCEMDRIGLPSIRPTFLFLARIPLDVLHECLRYRLEQHSFCPKPSPLSTKQLFREVKEVLRHATRTMEQYQNSVLQVVQGNPFQARIALGIESFDEDLRQTLAVYFNYLGQHTQHLMLNIENTSDSLKNLMDREWLFTKSVVPFVKRGRGDACAAFVEIVAHLLTAMRIFVDSAVTDNFTHLTETIEKGVCNWKSTDEETGSLEVGDGTDPSAQSSPVTDPGAPAWFWPFIKRRPVEKWRTTKKCLNHCSRALKIAFAETRSRWLRICHFIRHLCNTLETAVEYERLPISDLFDHMKLRGFALLRIPWIELNYSIFVPEALLNKTSHIVNLIRLMAAQPTTIPSEAIEGYLILVATGDMQWTGPSGIIQLPFECLSALGYITTVSNVYLIGPKAWRRRYHFEHRSSELRLLWDQTSPYVTVRTATAALKENVLAAEKNVVSMIETLRTDLSKVVDEVRTTCTVLTELADLQMLFCKTMQSYFVFAFEFMRGSGNVMTGKFHKSHSEEVVNLAHHWMDFVQESCSKGRGQKPQWAGKGLEYIAYACETNVTSHLDAEMFQQLKASISHTTQFLVGEEEGNSSQRPLEKLGLAVRSAPPRAENVTRIDRVRNACLQLESSRDRRFRELQLIGRATDTVVQHTHLPTGVRRVTFRWQRGIKIGAGEFGKVYTAVNMDNGILMAMKEIPVQTQDVQALKTVADEINNFEVLRHDNLVEYFGCEVHMDELFVFMEYCGGGTLSERCRVGLPEAQVRLYTLEILLALCYLHDKAIVHRDVKPANIFLTDDGRIKLGDFGCSVKLQNNTQMSLANDKADLKAAGTVAYMAPEVVAAPDKMGKPADIWSLGCVCLEMISGRRPWHNLDNNFAIMWQVGQGKRPPMPDKLDPDARRFLLRCFQQKPELRARSSHLIEEPFVKVSEEDARE